MASIVSSKSFRLSISFILMSIMAIQFIWTYSAGISFKESMLLTLLFGLCFLVSFLLIGNNLGYYRPQNFSFSFLVGWCLFFAGFCLMVPKIIIGFFQFQNDSIHEFLRHNLYIYFVFNSLILACYSAICLIWYHQKDNLENELRKQEAANLNREAELFKLRQQLQPHFLFNSLNSINALIGSKPNEARKMINQLSDFLRYTIKKEESEMVTLEEEISHLELYLEIEKVRFGNRLSTQFEIEEASKSLKIPALLLQPIVENAIKFGLYDTLEKVEIGLNANYEANILKIKITNPFDPQTTQYPKGTGFGLASVKKRLQLIFFRNDLLKTEIVDNIFTTEISIPQK
ncbi:MAG: histidine kinase [Bacteroidota bacterium]